MSAGTSFVEKSCVLTEAETECLFWLCSAAAEHEVESWSPVREWMGANKNNEKLLFAAVTNQEDGETSLHVILRKRPPLDIVRRMIEISPNILRVKDSNEMIPLHIACKHSASVEVVDKLIQGAPNTVNYIDRFSWLPIHFACANPESSVDVVMRLLRDANDTVLSKNDKDQLPIHLACGYGGSLGVIKRLLKDAPETVYAVDFLTRTPLILAQSHRASREVVDYLQEFITDRNEIKTKEAEKARRELETIISGYERLGKEESSKKTRNWIDKYRHNTSVSVPFEFFEVLWKLPRLLRERVLCDEFVRKHLNNHFCNRASTVYVMLDIYSCIIMIPLFYSASTRQIANLFPENTNTEHLFFRTSEFGAPVFFLILCGAYQFFRGLLPLTYILIHKSLFYLIATDTVYKWLRLANSIVIFIWVAFIVSPTYFTTESSAAKKEAFRCVAAIWILFLCLEAWNVLTYASIKFAVTSNGVKYVLWKIAYFLCVLLFVILTFSSMFSIIYSSTNICQNPDDFAFCRYHTSVMELYNLLYGNVEYSYYLSANGVELDPQREGNLAIAFYMFYMFLAVILFLNLLIAIIVDSYAMVKEDAEVSFWTQRMLFIIEVNQMQMLLNEVTKPFYCITKRCCFKKTSTEEDDAQETSYNVSYFRNWEKAFACFEDKSDVDENCNFWSNFIGRCACTLVISIWILLGILSAGYLWPPQVREWLFSVKREKENQRLPSTEDDATSMVQLQNEVLIANQTLSSRILLIDKKINQLTSKSADKNIKKQELQPELVEKKGITQIDDQDNAVNESLSVRLFHLDDKIDQLTVDSVEQKQDIQNLKSELGSLIKILVDKNEIQGIKSELEDIKKMLINLNSHLVYRS